MISEFFHAGGYPASKLNLSKDGYEAYKVIRRKINDTINNEKSGAISGIYAKLDTYSLRIALILHVMRIGCNEPDINPYQVSADTFCKAAELIQYFEHNALKVFNPNFSVELSCKTQWQFCIFNKREKAVIPLPSF